MNARPYDASNTRAALKVYDASEPARAKLWHDVESSDDIKKAEQADEKAMRLLRAAFLMDTKETNSKDHADVAGLDFIRNFVKCSRS